MMDDFCEPPIYRIYKAAWEIIKKLKFFCRQWHHFSVSRCDATGDCHKSARADALDDVAPGARVTI